MNVPQTEITYVTLTDIIVRVVTYVLIAVVLALSKIGIEMLWKKYQQVKNNQRTFVVTDGLVYKFVAAMGAVFFVVACVSMLIFFQIQSTTIKDIIGNATTQKQTSFRVAQHDSLLVKISQKLNIQ